MANRKFVAETPFMPESIICVSNGIWDVELYKSWTGKFDVRFATKYLSSFGSMWEDGIFHFSVYGAGYPPNYVLDLAEKMWEDNVSA